MTKADPISELARGYLYEYLLPLVLKAARLPETTSPEDLRALDLPIPQNESYVASRAMDFFTELCMPGISATLARLAGSEDCMQLHASIAGLIWRDAYERSRSREMAFVTNIPGCYDPAYDQAADLAMDNWRAWEQLDLQLKENFIDCFLEQMPVHEFFKGTYQ